MKSLLRVFLALALLLAGLPVTAASAQDTPGAAPAAADLAASTCTDGVQASGAVYRICMPPAGAWNGDLLVFAHGYVSPFEPVGIPEDQLVLPDGTSLPGIVNGLGYAFALSSYRVNGLAVLPGIQDTLDLVNLFRTQYPMTGRVYIAGASEGGLVTTLAVEQYPAVFAGGLATCGPVGDFRSQVNYWGDFRVVFDYFFPGVLPPSPVNIPPEVPANWETVYKPAVLAAIAANPSATSQLLRVTRAPIDAADPASLNTTVEGLLWYNAFATNDGVAKLGGQPFDNRGKWYTGSRNDLLLNLRVRRFRADAAAINTINANYQTSGVLAVPLVNLHTTGDPIVPYWHAPLYTAKVIARGSLLNYVHIPALRYGHCNFNVVEVLVSFAIMVIKSGGIISSPQEAIDANAGLVQRAESLLPDEAARQTFRQMLLQYLQTDQETMK
jgi:hypothetical protein